jgi:hypothetical protein
MNNKIPFQKFATWVSNNTDFVGNFEPVEKHKPITYEVILRRVTATNVRIRKYFHRGKLKKTTFIFE